MKLTKHFELEEFRVSRDFPEVAKVIEFTETDKAKLFYLCSIVLEPLRNIIRKPIYILSGKRTPHLNKIVGGAKNSDHLFRGFSCAADFYTRGKKKMYKLFRHLPWVFNYAVGEAILYFDEKWNPRFIHLSLPTEKHQRQFFYDYNRGEMFGSLVDLPNEVYVAIFKKGVEEVR